MKKSAYWTKTTISIILLLILQACYVQKNSETHAAVIYKNEAEAEIIPEYNNDMITVVENHDPIATLEALSARILLIDFEKESISPRWEDNINHRFSKADTKPIIAERGIKSNQ